MNELLNECMHAYGTTEQSSDIFVALNQHDREKITEFVNRPTGAAVPIQPIQWAHLFKTVVDEILHYIEFRQYRL